MPGLFAGVVFFLIACGVVGWWTGTSWKFSWLPLGIGIVLLVGYVLVGSSVSHEPPNRES